MRCVSSDYIFSPPVAGCEATAEAAEEEDEAEASAEAPGRNEAELGRRRSEAAGQEVRRLR